MLFLYIPGKGSKIPLLCDQIEHGSETSRPFRKLWQTEQLTDQPTNLQTDRMSNRDWVLLFGGLFIVIGTRLGGRKR